MNQQVLTMVVDLDERGSFRAHVENQTGKTVFEFSNEGDNGWPDEDGLWLVESGFMKHTLDVEGLHGYMIDVGLANPQSTMRMRV